jgi:hypothetical protein
MIVTFIDVPLSGKFLRLRGDKCSTHMKIVGHPANAYPRRTLKFRHRHHEVVLRTGNADPHAEMAPNLFKAVRDGKKVVEKFTKRVVGLSREKGRASGGQRKFAGLF